MLSTLAGMLTCSRKTQPRKTSAPSSVSELGRSTSRIRQPRRAPVPSPVILPGRVSRRAWLVLPQEGKASVPMSVKLSGRHSSVTLSSLTKALLPT